MKPMTPQAALELARVAKLYAEKEAEAARLQEAAANAAAAAKELHHRITTLTAGIALEPAAKEAPHV